MINGDLDKKHKKLKIEIEELGLNIYDDANKIKSSIDMLNKYGGEVKLRNIYSINEHNKKKIKELQNNCEHPKLTEICHNEYRCLICKQYI